MTQIHIDPTITVLENRLKNSRHNKLIAQHNLLQACKEGRYQDVPALTVKWQEWEDEFTIAKDRIKKLRNG